MLRERQVGKLRAAVCTFACPERLGGIVDLMDMGYPTGEYWLPESLRIVAEAARGFNGDWPAWFALCGRPVPKLKPPVLQRYPSDPLEEELTGCAMLAILACACCVGKLPEQTPLPLLPTQAIGAVLKILTDHTAKNWSGTLSSLLRDVGNHFVSGGGPADLALLCGRLLFRAGNTLKVKHHKGCRTAARGLAMVIMVEALRARDNHRIRFFQRTDQWEDKLVPRHPFKCLNGIEVSTLSRKDDSVNARTMHEAALSLTEPGGGLVYQYGDRHCGALFCGNTKMSFLHRHTPTLVRRPTVITAPQRGGLDVEDAYGYIISTDPSSDVWVRAHYSYARKVSDSFKNKPVRYCLYNCAYRTVQEVLLTFSEGRWKSLAGGICSCDDGSRQTRPFIASNNTFAKSNSDAK